MKLLKMGTALLIMIISFGCEEVEVKDSKECPEVENPEVYNRCMKGEVIGKIRSAGGGLAVALDKNYEGAVTWPQNINAIRRFKNVIELLNIPTRYTTSGTIIYFSSREATVCDIGVITADGDESIKLLLYGLEFSSAKCP